MRGTNKKKRSAVLPIHFRPSIFLCHSCIPLPRNIHLFDDRPLRCPGSISGSAEAAAAAPAEVVGRLTTLDDKLGGGDLRSLVSIGMHDSARSGGRGLRQVPFHASRAACGDALCPMRRGRSGASTPAMSERNRERECWWRLRDQSLHCMN